MEDPNWNLAEVLDETGHHRRAIARHDRSRAAKLRELPHPSADRYDGGEQLGMPVGDVPGPVSAHREAGEIDPTRIHVRSEERRVGKECRSRCGPDHDKEKVS